MTDQAVDIQLENVTKRYPGGRQAAVEDFSMSIAAGEIEIGRASCRERV